MNNDPSWYLDLLTIAVNAKEPATADSLLDIMHSNDKAGICSTGQQGCMYCLHVLIETG
jgi:hypothetical protein